MIAAQFQTRATPNELGLNVLLGGQVSCVPPADVPSVEAAVKRVWKELDDRFVPLWVTNTYRTPNYGTVKSTCFAIGRYIPHPRHKQPVIKGLLLPTRKVYGRMPQNPIVLANILDGLSDEERARGDIQKYQHFHESYVSNMKWWAWVQRNVSFKHQDQAADQAEASAEEAWLKPAAAELTYRRKTDDHRLKCVAGDADRVYVSSTLIQPQGEAA